MMPTRQIPPPEWMIDYRTARLMRVLGGFEIPAQALFVGGCVRNALLDKPVQDIDIATIHPPLQVIEKLTAAGIRHIPTGLDHGTVTAIVDDASFEITTLRKDIETDGRYAVIAFTSSWQEDANRRDFTINTLLASPEGMVFDPTGAGLSDLDLRRVVFVGNASERIAEDYLRILRFFRFYAQYGDEPPNEDALEACRLHADKISSLSRERITQEFLKILAVPQAHAILNLMFKNGVLKPMAKNYKPAIMENLCAMQARYDAGDVMARLLPLSAMKPDYFEQWLVLSNVQKKYLEGLALGLQLLKSVSKKKMRELVYRTTNKIAVQVYMLKLAEKGDFPDLEILDIAQYWQAPDFPVKGEDLIATGIHPGPALGQKLKELEEKWIAKDFPSDI